MSVLLPAIVLYSRNMERTVKFYNRLGFQFKVEKHGEGPRHYACECGGIILELYPRSGQVGETSRMRAMDCRIVVPVESLQVTLKTVSRLSKVVLSPREDGAYYTALIEDPDGRHVLLREKQG